MDDASHTRRRFLKAAGGTATTIALAGCASDRNSQSTPDTSPTNGENPARNGETPEPQMGGTIEYLEKNIAPSLDPHHTNGNGAAENYITYNTLVRYNQNLEFDPVLATDWTVENDGTRYVFPIREGVTFHDGSQLNAEVVKWNFDRMLSDYSQVAANFNYIDAVSVTGDYEVTVDLKEVFPVFLDNLNADGHIVSKQAVEKHGTKYLQKHPIGTGPFELTSWDQQQGVVTFSKYEDYWEEDRPRVDKWVMRGIPSGQTRVSAFKENGNYLHGPPPESLSELRKSKSYTTVNILGKSNTIDYLTFNCEHGPFSDATVREAAYYAIDNQKILEFLSGAEPIKGPLPASNWGSNPNITPEHDLQKAQSLMGEAGVSDGFAVTLKIWKDDPGRQNLATVTKQQLKQLNIDVKIEILASDTLIDQMINQPDSWEFASLHWGGGGHIDPYGTLNVLFDSEGQYNWITNFKNENINTLVRAALDTTDRAVRKEKYQQAEMEIFNKHPMIWFGRFTQFDVIYDDVHAVKPIRPTGYFPRFERVWVEQ